MVPTPSIRRLKRREIDTQRWDAAVDAHPVPLVYGLHWWLDAATDYSWEGLVVDDYRVVLALPRLRRYRVVPVYVRPPYTQQVGPFGTLREGDVTALLGAVPHLPYIALPLVAHTATQEVPVQYQVRRRTNFVVDLSPDFSEVLQRFAKSRRGNVRKYSTDVLGQVDRQGVVALYRERLSGRGGLRNYHFHRLDALIAACLERELVDLYELREDGELLGAGVYPRYRGRIFNIAAASTERGLQRRGMTRMMAKVMSLQSGKPGAKFDLAGSELPGVREYFASFGGEDEGYYLAARGWLGRR